MKKKKTIVKRILSIALSMLLLLGNVAPVYAQEAAFQDSISEVEQLLEETVEVPAEDVVIEEEEPIEEEVTEEEQPVEEEVTEEEEPVEEEVTEEEEPVEEEVTEEEEPVEEEVTEEEEPVEEEVTEEEQPVEEEVTEEEQPVEEEVTEEELLEEDIFPETEFLTDIGLENADNGLVIEDGVVTGFTGTVNYDNGLTGKVNFDNLVIPEGVTAVAEKAFLNVGVIQVTFPTTIKRIEKEAFALNSELVKINFATNSQLEYIGPGAFYKSSITEVTIPASVKTIASGAFGACPVLTEATILSKDLEIEYLQRYSVNGNWLNSCDHCGPFGGDSKLASINYSGDVIPAHLFQRCSGLTSYTVGSNVTEIGPKAFEGCSGLAEVNFAKDGQLVKIDESAFINCREITSITIPDTVTTIEKGAFAICTKLESIKLSSNLKVLGTAAFSCCPALKSIEIPASLEEIAYNYNYSPFYATTGYGSFSYCGPFGGSGPGGPYQVENTNIETITFGKGIKVIPDYLFAGYVGTGKIVIPSSVTKIGYGAFKNCNNLDGVFIPKSVTEIEDTARIGTRGETICSNNENFAIYGYKQTVAEQYAKDHKLLFNGYGLEFDEPEINVYIDNFAVDLSARLVRENFEGGTISWSVGDTSIANVSPKGYLTGVKTGKTTVTACVDDFELSATANVKVIKSLKHGDIKVTEIPDKAYTGKAIKPVVSVYDGEKKLVLDKDYTVVYRNNKNSGEASIDIIGKGYYCESTTVNFNIMKSMADTKVTLEYPDGKTYVEYTGNPIAVAVKSVTYGGVELKDGSYNIEYASNVDAGTAVIRLVGREDAFFTGVKVVKFTIKGIQVTNSEKVAINVDKVVYNNGEELEPEVTVSRVDEEIALVEDKDYKLVYSNNKNPGTASVMVIGIGGYEGSKSIQFSIAKPSFAKAVIGEAADNQIVIEEMPVLTYNGKVQKPGICATYNGKALVEKTDYTLEYSKNKNAGTASVVITGKGAFTGKKTLKFTINPMPLTEENGVSVLVDDMGYNRGLPVKPVPKVVHAISASKSVALEAGKDYQKITAASYSNNTEATTSEPATVTIVGKGNYTGSITGTFRIATVKASKLVVDAIPNQKYVLGQKAEPEITVRYQGKILPAVNEDESVNYKVAYENSHKAGTAAVVITGAGKFYGTKKVTYKIQPKAMSGNVITVLQEEIPYTGYAHKPDVLIKDGDYTLVKGTDYTLSYAKNTNVGKASIVIKGKGNYKGEVKKSFKITKWNLSEANIEIAPAYFNLNKVVKPAVTVKININGELVKVNPKAVILTYSNNKKVTNPISPAVVKITSKNTKYIAGSRKDNFEIQRADITKATISAIKNQTFAGLAVEPKITVKYKGTTLKKGTDYEVTYKNNERKGVATVQITGIGNYAGMKTANYIIR